MITEDERFNTNRPDLCHLLCWKGKFAPFDLGAKRLPSIDGHFWCTFTQTCIGPDGQLAEPGNCSSSGRTCYETHKGS